MTLDDRRLRWLLWAALALVGAGLYAFVLRGADGPADPELADPVARSRPGDPTRVPFGGFEEIAIEVDPGDGRGLLAWCLLAALTQEQRSRGLMEVEDFQGYSGMAFVYPEPVQNEFHMRNTPTPLSIAWIDGDGHLVSTAEMEPCEDREGCPRYAAAGPYEMAIEVVQGGLDDLGIIPGSTTVVTDGCAPRTGTS